VGRWVGWDMWIVLFKKNEKSCLASQCLASQGHKVSLAKLQFVTQRVKFLGYIIIPEDISLSEDRIGAIQAMAKPVTKNITHDHDLTLTDSVTWTSAAEAASV